MVHRQESFPPRGVRELDASYEALTNKVQRRPQGVLCDDWLALLFMACEICHRSSCTRSFHSLEEQELFDERQTMSDDVDDLRRDVQNYRCEIKRIANDYIPDSDKDAPLALQEMRDALKSLLG